MKGGLDGFGFAVLYLLSFNIKSLKICNIVSKSVLLSFFENTFGIVVETPSADRDGLPKRGEGAGELDLDETVSMVRTYLCIKTWALSPTL